MSEISNSAVTPKWREVLESMLASVTSKLAMLIPALAPKVIS